MKFNTILAYFASLVASQDLCPPPGCIQNWRFKGIEQTLCSNPDNDPRGPWCPTALTAGEYVLDSGDYELCFPCGDDCTGRPNRNIQVSDVIDRLLVDSAERCEEKCLENDDCRFWKWHSHSHLGQKYRKICVLGRKKSEEKDEDHVTAGGPCEAYCSDSRIGEVCAACEDRSDETCVAADYNRGFCETGKMGEHKCVPVSCSDSRIGEGCTTCEGRLGKTCVASDKSGVCETDESGEHKCVLACAKTDGSAANTELNGCQCGSGDTGAVCEHKKFCNIAWSGTTKCSDKKTCANTDGSAANTETNGCQCGGGHDAAVCAHNEFCNIAWNGNARCSDKKTCANTDGLAANNEASGCQCGGGQDAAVCEHNKFCDTRLSGTAKCSDKNTKLGNQCWDLCGKKSGPCNACGVGGKCCRKNYKGGENGCLADEGTEKHHVCVEGAGVAEGASCKASPPLTCVTGLTCQSSDGGTCAGGSEACTCKKAGQATKQNTTTTTTTTMAVSGSTTTPGSNARVATATPPVVMLLAMATYHLM